MDEFEFIFFLSDSEFKIFLVGVENELILFIESGNIFANLLSNKRSLLSIDLSFVSHEFTLSLHD